ncbi:MAG: Rieske 2Fe-2S domain-containing protein [Caulobacter sp.]|nr:Rieske 2Fe-2S domain-containing protein [Caulobacter sp.]
MAGAVWIGRDLPPIYRQGEAYFLLSVDDQLYLVRNVCPHRGGPLKFGHVDDQNRIVCPMHHNAYPVEVLLAQPTTVKLSEAPHGQT